MRRAGAEAAKLLPRATCSAWGSLTTSAQRETVTAHVADTVAKDATALASTLPWAAWATPDAVAGTAPTGC
ncbi:hypothetical protein IFM12275_12770 [Nocardia sputorum]|uniref:Uncharacterized protein n=1 Tax=Nocardia sputorum TaxID=2984338 RepID=A0ABN6U3U5_9NOCA|nr:hypothetical protein IFM12275_12770 [Nocardia sputorum]BDT99937.1 hypothetical protein IFM12276_29660 [Nocardia sputorum]